MKLERWKTIFPSKKEEKPSEPINDHKGENFVCAAIKELINNLLEGVKGKRDSVNIEKSAKDLEKEKILASFTEVCKSIRYQIKDEFIGEKLCYKIKE